MATLSVSPSEQPFLSVILATRDRPYLLSLALTYYMRQTYRPRELIVVDDGEQYPVEAAAVERAGGRLLRLSAPTSLGQKLNLGVGTARGLLCAKMDDDDWYAPQYLETMVRAIQARSVRVCRPTIAFLAPFLFFNVAAWEVRKAEEGSVPGATLVFAREDWQERPFRNVSNHEDMWFYRDQVSLGIVPLPVRAPEVFIAVRHGAYAGDRGHTWTQQWQGQELDAALKDRPLYRSPEALFPAWALPAYQELRRAMTTGSSETSRPVLPE